MKYITRYIRKKYVTRNIRRDIYEQFISWCGDRSINVCLEKALRILTANIVANMATNTESEGDMTTNITANMTANMAANTDRDKSSKDNMTTNIVANMAANTEQQTQPKDDMTANIATNIAVNIAANRLGNAKPSSLDAFAKRRP